MLIVTNFESVIGVISVSATGEFGVRLCYDVDRCLEATTRWQHLSCYSAGKHRDLLQVLGKVDGRLEFIDDNCARTTDRDDVRVVLMQLPCRPRTLAHTHADTVVSVEWADRVKAWRHAPPRDTVVVACYVADLQQTPSWHQRDVSKPCSCAMLRVTVFKIVLWSFEYTHGRR